MPARIDLSFYGDVQLSRTLARWAANAIDARPAWDALAERFAVVEKRQFSSQGKNSGGWAPLSPRYAAWKAVHYPGRPILERTGDLKNSLTQRPFGIDIIEEKSMAVGSQVGYGLYHQRGTGRMPRRRPVEFTDYERSLWAKTLQRFISTGIARAGS